MHATSCPQADRPQQPVAMGCQTAGMAGDEELFDFLADLEAQAVALHDAERQAEVADRARTEYREVTLSGRLMASRGRDVQLSVAGLGLLSGRLARVAPDWCAVETAGAEWFVLTRAVLVVRGASERAVPERAWRRTDRLGLGSVLRRLADERVRCQVHLVDGTSVAGVPGRVGGDFVEVQESGPVLVPLAHVGAVCAPGRR